MFAQRVPKIKSQNLLSQVKENFIKSSFFLNNFNIMCIKVLNMGSKTLAL